MDGLSARVKEVEHSNDVCNLSRYALFGRSVGWFVLLAVRVYLSELFVNPNGLRHVHMCSVRKLVYMWVCLSRVHP